MVPQKTLEILFSRSCTCTQLQISLITIALDIQTCHHTIACKAKTILVYLWVSNIILICHYIPLQIPKGHLWLLGDNADDSTDSRDYGPVPYGLVRGRVCFKVHALITQFALYIENYRWNHADLESWGWRKYINYKTVIPSTHPINIF